MANLNDWTTTLGDEKVISGYATSNASVLDNMAGWAAPQLLLRHRKTGKSYAFDADLDADAALFSYTLTDEDLDRAGVYDVAFRATDPDGNDHTFPEGPRCTLEVYPRLDA